MTLYRKRQTTVEAFKWMPTTLTMEGKHPIPDWLEPSSTVNGQNLEIWSLGGIQRAYPNDWIVKDGAGKYHVLSSEVFEATYELVKG